MPTFGNVHSLPGYAADVVTNIFRADVFSYQTPLVITVYAEITRGVIALR